MPLPLVAPGKKHDTTLFLKWASFDKIRLKWAYFIFGISLKTEYILKKRDLKPGFLRIRDFWAFWGKICPLISLKWSLMVPFRLTIVCQMGWCRWKVKERPVWGVKLNNFFDGYWPEFQRGIGFPDRCEGTGLDLSILPDGTLNTAYDHLSAWGSI